MSISDLSPFLGSSSVVPLLTSQPKDNWVHILHTSSGSRREQNMRELFRAVIQSHNPSFLPVADLIKTQIRLSRQESKELEKRNYRKFGELLTPSAVLEVFEHGESNLKRVVRRFHPGLHSVCAMSLGFPEVYLCKKPRGQGLVHARDGGGAWP